MFSNSIFFNMPPGCFGGGLQLKKEDFMKRVLMAAVLTMVVSFALRTGTVQAQGPVGLKFSIPFNFVVGEALLPAGDYLIKTYHSQMLLIQNPRGDRTVIVMTSPQDKKFTEAGKGLGKAIFHKYGDTCFLYRVENQTEDMARQLSVSKKEKEVARLLVTPVLVAVAEKH
jgi:hypothetical protein